jgi:hypothetical protein
MADLNDRIQRLILSGEELRQLTDWAPALVEDYLGISDDIAQITNTVIKDGDDLTELEERVTETEQQIVLLWLAIENLQEQIDDLEQEDPSNALTQLVNPAFNVTQKQLDSLDKKLIPFYNPPKSKPIYQKMFEGFVGLFSKLIKGRNRWRGKWLSDIVYDENDEVLDGNWLMIANKKTIDRAAPQLTGSANYIFGQTRLVTDDGNWLTCVNGDTLFAGVAVGFVTKQFTGVVRSGHVYEFTQTVFVTELSVLVPTLTDTTNYIIVVADITNPENPVTEISKDPILEENVFTVVKYSSALITAGTKLLIYIDALNSGDSTVFQHEWTSNGTSNAGAPLTGGWNRRTQQDIIRIDKTDNTGADRTAELASVIVGSSITTRSTADFDRFWEYLINGITDAGTYYEYATTLTGTGSLGGINDNENTLIEFDIPIPLPTDYVEDDAYNWSTSSPSFADVEGFLSLGGVTQNVPESAFGVDIRVQPVTTSPDWDIKNTAGEVVGSSTSASRGDSVISINDNEEINPLYTSYDVQAPPNTGVANETQITFGAAKGNMSALGTWTCPSDGQYAFALKLSFERSNSGGEALFWVYSTVNGAMSGTSQFHILDTSRQREHLSFTVDVNLNREDEIKFYFYLDSTSQNDGALTPRINPDGRPSATSASLSVTQSIIE